MIRVGLASDLHVEFDPEAVARLTARLHRGDLAATTELQRWLELGREPGHPEGPDLRSLKADDVDFLVLAGDVHVGLAAVEYADAAARYLDRPVFLVAGNHESYGHDLVALGPAAKAAAARTEGRVRLLEMDRADVEICGVSVAILGATMWTDYRAAGDEARAMSRALVGLNDHARIGYGRASIFRPRDARAIHKETRAWLAREIPRARDQADIVVVVTHHAPILEANGPEHDGSDLAASFVSDLRAEILAWAPDAWFWGHTHHSYRGELGGTLLASAQRGYPIDPGSETFQPAVIEIAPRRTGDREAR